MCSFETRVPFRGIRNSFNPNFVQRFDLSQLIRLKPVNNHGSLPAVSRQ